MMYSQPGSKPVSATPSPSKDQHDVVRFSTAPLPTVASVAVALVSELSSVVRPAAATTITPCTPGKKRGRKPAFTTEQNLLILREVAVKETHIADFGQKGAKFEEVTRALKATGAFKEGLECKSVQDRYHRLQRDFDKDDLRLSRMSDVGGDVTEAEELFPRMTEARGDLLKQKEVNKLKAKAIEERKRAAGRRMVDIALNRRGKRKKTTDGQTSSPEDDSSSEDEDEDNSDTGEKKTKKRRKTNYAGNLAGDLAAFGQSIHASDSAQLDFDREKLALEQDRFAYACSEKERDRMERQKERDEERTIRKEERLAQNTLELDKFKLMMDFFVVA